MAEKDVNQQMKEFFKEIDIETRMEAAVLNPPSGPFFTEQEKARIREIMQQSVIEDPPPHFPLELPQAPGPALEDPTINPWTVTPERTGQDNGRVGPNAWC